MPANRGKVTSWWVRITLICPLRHSRHQPGKRFHLFIAETGNLKTPTFNVRCTRSLPFRQPASMTGWAAASSTDHGLATQHNEPRTTTDSQCPVLRSEVWGRRPGSFGPRTSYWVRIPVLLGPQALVLRPTS